MSTGVPDFITLEGPLYANALATAEGARDERTGTAAVVLRAPAATAACLERARSALLALREIEPPLPGLPSVIPNAPHDDVGQEATLILGELRGGLVRERLLRDGALTEAAVLTLGREQAQLLATLHHLGYSGLRPTSDETWVWWDSETPRATFLGWEWLVAGAEDAWGDVRAAAGLWIELAAGLPPWLDLTATAAPAAWTALSLGLRLLLCETRRAVGPTSAGWLAGELAELQRRASMSAVDLLARGRELLPMDPASALVWLDLARRGMPPVAGADGAYQVAEAAIKGQGTNWIEQGRRDMGLGQYESAERSFMRAQTAWHAGAELKLAAARWRTAAQALRQAVQADLTVKGLPVRDLERALIDVVGQANADLIDTARGDLEELIARVPAGDSLPALDALQADFRACQQWSRGRAAQETGQKAEASTLFAGASGRAPTRPPLGYPGRDPGRPDWGLSESAACDATPGRG